MLRRVPAASEMRRRFRTVAPVLAVLAALASRGVAGEVTVSPGAFAGKAATEEKALRKVLEVYVDAIESKDVGQFRVVKPNLSDDEAKKARRAFESLQSQRIEITVLSVEFQDGQALVRVRRRDTINGSIVNSFPQSFSLAKTGEDWTIREIGR
jgi:hypothetical protein